jgi:hypothetical protein
MELNQITKGLKSFKNGDVSIGCRFVTEARLDLGVRKQRSARFHHNPKGVAKVVASRKLTIRTYSGIW